MNVSTVRNNNISEWDSLVKYNIMAKGKRTGIDFSKHELLVTQNEYVNIWHLKIPDTIHNNIKFTNVSGVLVVTGDFGNWIFCREFHPSADGYVSAGYWDEKLQISSVQKSHIFDTDETKKQINEFVSTFEDSFGQEMNEDETDWVESLRSSVDDEHKYIYTAYRENPSSIDYESIPFGKVRHRWLDIIYDGFDHICQLCKEHGEMLDC